MAKVAREMVEQAGIDVDKLLDLLVKNASAKLTTYYYYTILRVNLIAWRARGSRPSPRMPALKIAITLRCWPRASTS